ncbi:MAG TPA: PDZ domain-containing protein [Thermoanaerobaculia bacterium]|nr:PDZ domain-containing protein [Thermoanaerobaculia bacterium]HXT52647.1 PDZ domain-containing protein [Thermoanaerobaculia bacterium]
MDAHRLLRGLKLFVPLLSLLACGAAEGRSWSPHRGGSTASLAVAGGTLEVSLRPDRGPTLRLVADGPHRWTFEGPTSNLVGGSYSILLRNRTDERLKVVVAVDGLNVYGREVVAGSSDEDVGSILSPWTDRSLPGWQLDSERAQRFLFSPPEWSEGQGRTESQIGTVTVQVYREWQEPRWQYYHQPEERDGAAAAPKEAPAAEPEVQGGAESRHSDADLAEEPPIALRRRGPIGTASGDDVDSWVRTVRFVAATSFPESWAVIDYGTGYAQSPPRPRWDDLLGLDLAPAADGTRIVDVAPGSAADRAGLEPGDVIVRIDTVFGPSTTATRRILAAKAHGDFAFLRVRRGPHELALKIRA